MRADSPIAPGTRLEKLADRFEFIEEPATDADGNILFTDQPNDRILKWSQGWTANGTFGGQDRYLLFITASKSIYSLKMQLRGVR